MFQKNNMPIRETGHEPETIIAASVKVEGEFTSQGNVLIEGVVEGSLHTDRDLRVGEKARIDADITAANAVIAGEIHGNIVVAERLELEPSARIYGDVRTKVLVVASGANMNGRLLMGTEAGEEKPQRTVKKATDTEAVKVGKAERASAEAVEEEKEKRTVNAFFTG